MHTSALPPLPTAESVATYHGWLASNAEARSMQADNEGHFVPVLCMDVRLDWETQNIMRVEQPFPPGSFDQCKAAARRYKKGTEVTFQAPLNCLRLVARNASHIHPVKATQEESTPCQA